MGDISSVLGGAFHADQYEPAEDFEPLPAGEYPVMVDEAEMKTTKAGTGRFLKLGMVVIGEQYAGRKLFANINIRNPNPKAEEIGLRDLASLTVAVGLAVIEDSTDLLGKQLLVKIKVKPADGQYGPSNDVRAYKPLNGTTAKPKTAAAPAQPRQTQAATTAAPAGNKPPWMR